MSILLKHGTECVRDDFPFVFVEQVHERASKQLREQVRQLQDDLIASNRSLALLNRRGLDDVDGSSDVDDVGDVISAAAASLGDGAARAPPPAGHCGVQQSKQLARQVRPIKIPVARTGRGLELATVRVERGTQNSYK